MRLFYKRKKQNQNKENQNKQNQNKQNQNKNKWIILLTIAVNVNDESEYRKNLYKTQILNWLRYTNYYIYVIESTGVDLNITHERLKFFSFELPKLASSSQGEAASILHILNIIKNDALYIDCTHILKVTGRYFLHNINGVLNNCVPDLDVYIQHHHSIKWQNTEYFGIRKMLLENFLLTVVNEGLMEHKFYEFIIKNKLKFIRIGPFVNNVERGGDKLIIRQL
jgi:hypothetical protein